MTSIATLEDIVARIEVAMEESQKRLAESQVEIQKRLAESQIESQKKWDESHVESQKKWDETQERLTKSHERLEATLDRWVGRFGNQIGYLVEMILIPGIKPKINAFGHNFNSLAARKQYYFKDGREFAEIDLFLENGADVMAVEVKTRLSVSGVERHLARLKLLREYETETNLTGKTLYAGVAALEIDPDAREMALNLGMYLIEMVESTKYVNVIKPSVPLGKW